MLHIRPINNNDNFENLKDGLFYIALNNDELLGYCKYKKQDDFVVIEEINDGGDVNLFDGLLRAVFNYVSEIKIDKAIISETVDKDRLKALFVPVDDKNCVNSITDFLYNCKKCKMC